MIEKKQLYQGQDFKIQQPKIFSGVVNGTDSPIGNIALEPHLQNKLVYLNEIPRGILEVCTLAEMARIAELDPQKNPEGEYIYLFSGGLAIEAITGVTRQHHDVDAVEFTPNAFPNTRDFIDSVRPEKYWVYMKFTQKFLEETAWEEFIEFNGETKSVFLVHPAILFVQKLSDFSDTYPRRPKDDWDAQQLFNYWQTILNCDSSWMPIIEASISVLPLKQQPITRGRLVDYLGKK